MKFKNIVLSCLLIFLGLNISQLSASSLKTDVEKIFVYGKYCGAKLTSTEKPIDPVDYICMLHDQCLNKSSKSCQCDIDFYDRMRKIKIGKLKSSTWIGDLPKKGAMISTKTNVIAKSFADIAGPAVYNEHQCNCQYKKGSKCKLIGCKSAADNNFTNDIFRKSCKDPVKNCKEWTTVKKSVNNAVACKKLLEKENVIPITKYLELKH